MEAVRAGRQEAFSLQEADDVEPDPQDVATFERSKLQPELHREGQHQALHAFYRELLALRRTVPTLTDPRASRDVMEPQDERVIILQVHARADAAETIAILGFADSETRVSLPIPAGDWVKRLDAGDARFLGNGAVVPDRLHSDGAIELTLPPHAVLLFERGIRNG
jgi:maltooligosyltrehalose trehalohydrolase